MSQAPNVPDGATDPVVQVEPTHRDDVVESRVFDRLVMVTHREPFRVVERDGVPCIERTTGGMIAALEPAMRAIKGLWVSADVRGDIDRASLDQTLDQTAYEWSPVGFSDELFHGFYEGFSNQALWPLYHSMLGYTSYHREDWAAYVEVNRRFAQVASERLRANDFVWVHDYQLSLVPQMLRAAGVPEETRIGYYLHIPFPNYALFRTLPWAEQVLRGMLGASLVGFHVAEYCSNFFDCVEEILGVRCDRLRGRIFYEGRWVHVRAVPIGIDHRSIHETVGRDEVRERAASLRDEAGCEKLVIGVDRLDYTKGIPQRLQALETFFEKYPERRGQVSFVQIAVPSRAGIGDYQQLREDIERQVGHINGLYARPGWTPITYMYRSLPFDQLVALYHAADVALVTPLRDGMNLVAKEYVAAHRGRDGVLILSQLAGAAEQLTEAMLVNPYDIDGMAETIEAALTLPPRLAQRRMRILDAKVARYDVQHWIDSFLNEGLYVD